MHETHGNLKRGLKAGSVRLSRGEFLARLGWGTLAVGAWPLRSPGTESGPGSTGSGKPSKVKRWDVVTIGNLSRNYYWGEGDAAAVRKAICTCTLVQGENFRLIVDPSLTKAKEMETELDRRTGLKLADIDTAFITHEHADHWFGLVHFTRAKWLAAPEVASALNKTGKLPKPVEAATGQLFGAVDIFPTPGHTLSHRSLRLECDGKLVVVAGDAVATRDFWRERRGYFNVVDAELSAKSMEEMARTADIVVPGHDNFFLVERRGG